MNSRISFAAFLIAASTAAAPLSALAQKAEPAKPADAVASQAAEAAYLLGRDDVLQVGLLGRSDFGGRVRVLEDGTIQLPFVGKVQASDRTVEELSAAIRKGLQTGGYFADPVVTIDIVEYASRYVTVLGSVGAPGLVPLHRPSRLSELLARVGGVKDGAADYLVVRSRNGDERKLSIKDLATGDLAQDPFVKPGDKIYAPAAETFYIYGQVNASGVYPIQSDMSVRMALARGGGLTQSGSDRKITVTRGGRKLRLELEDKVQPGDVLVVGERIF